jgi:hypothetical protein
MICEVRRWLDRGRRTLVTKPSPNPDNPARNGRTPSCIRALRLFLTFHVAATPMMVCLSSLWALPTAHCRGFSLAA